MGSVPQNQRYSRFRGQAGDTIVEVLIAAAVIGLVLTGAYSIANKSLKQIQSSQERGEATKVAATAMERLSSAVKQDAPANKKLTANSPLSPNPFCLRPDLTPVPLTDSSCTVGRYGVSINRDSDPSNKRFAVTVSWEGIDGVMQRANYSYYVSTL